MTVYYIAPVLKVGHLVLPLCVCVFSGLYIYVCGWRVCVWWFGAKRVGRVDSGFCLL